jgi:hypothetical protein
MIDEWRVNATPTRPVATITRQSRDCAEAGMCHVAVMSRREGDRFTWKPRASVAE